MTNLPRHQVYRLRLLSERPRAYTFRDSVMPTLEQRGLVERTGRYDDVRQRRQWAITEEGRRLLSEAEGVAA